MVYCGKPSKGCSSCRERKIRDQRELGCGQCEKRRQRCPGYRNLVDLMFRDESSHVIRKAAKARQAKSRSPNPGIDPIGSVTSDVSLEIFFSPHLTDPGRNAISPLPPSPLTRSPVLPVPDNSHCPLLGRGRHEIMSASFNVRVHGEEINNLPSPTDGKWPQPSPTALLYTLTPSLEQQGIAYFFAQYVTADEGSRGQPFDFIFDLWRPARSLAERQNDCVMAAMVAVGLAGLAVLKNCPNTLDLSRTSYCTALVLTNKALQYTADAIKDTTMLSVLILCMYEVLTGRDLQTFQAWQEHVNGAATLARMRGTGQFTSQAGIRMFNMLAQIVLISCVQRGLPMPSNIAQLKAELEILQPRGRGDPGWNSSPPIFRVLQLRHDLKGGALTETDKIVHQLLVADKELSDLATTSLTRDTSGYRLVRVKRRNSVVFGDYCHVYESPSQAAAWNDLRSIRMLAHETILEAVRGEHDTICGIVSIRHRDLLSRSVKELETLRDAILATVPQYLGNIKFRDIINTNDGASGVDTTVATVEARNPPVQLAFCPQSTASLHSRTPPIRAESAMCMWDVVFSQSPPVGSSGVMALASASNRVVWPLYVVGASSSSTDKVKDYVVARLSDIYRETGLPQALTAAAMVETGAASIHTRG